MLFFEKFIKGMPEELKRVIAAWIIAEFRDK